MSSLGTPSSPFLDAARLGTVQGEDQRFPARAKYNDRTASFELVPPIAGLPTKQKVLVNPTSFRESWEPQYARRGVLGGSQEVLQYIRTDTRSISVDLWVSAQIYLQMFQTNMGTGKTPGGVSHDMPNAPEKGVLHYRDYFAALSVPVKPRGTPPVVEFIWPNASLCFRGVITAIEFEYERFADDGTPMDMTIRLNMLENSTRLRTSARVFTRGFGYNAE